MKSLKGWEDNRTQALGGLDVNRKHQLKYRTVSQRVHVEQILNP